MSVHVSIIICTCNRADDLRSTLAALASLQVPKDLPTELVVVDNASTDGTAALVQNCRLSNMTVRHIYEPRRGKGYAYNTGMAEAQGQIFLFTDDDVRPSLDWIAGMCRPILAGEAEAVVGSVTLPPHLEKPWMEVAHKNMMASTDGIESRSEFTLVGANMAFSRAVLARVPGFDVELGPGALGFMDESFFSMQLRSAGFRLARALDAEVVHHFDESRLTRASFYSRALNQGRSEAYVAYHWQHQVPTKVISHLMRQWFRLYYYRLRRLGKHPWPEGLPKWEFGILREIGFDQQMLIEQRRVRNYEQHGLIKRAGLGGQL